MEDKLDPRTIEELNHINWIDRRRRQEEAHLLRAAELRDTLNTYRFQDDDQRLAYAHSVLMELDKGSPYINRSVTVNGNCMWQVYNSKTGAARIKSMPFVDAKMTDRGMTLLAHDHEDDGEGRTVLAIGHLLEYTEGESIKHVVAPLEGADLTYDLAADDYEDALRSVMPAEMVDLLRRITAVTSDDELQSAVNLMARMRVDGSHLSSITMRDISNYVGERLAINDKVPYVIVMNEHILQQEGGYKKITPSSSEVQAVQIMDTVLLPSIEGTDWRWFFHVLPVTTGGIYGEEGEFLVPLSSIEALQRIQNDEDEMNIDERS